MEKPKTISEQMAEFTLGLTYKDIPKDVIDHGKLLLTDTFGVAMACQDLEHAKAVKKTVLEMNSQKVCSLWGTDEKAMLADAILYNSCLIHGMDYDDTHVGSIIHPSAAVVSTAFTVGEMVGATGKQMLEAIVAGWEIIVRLGLAAKGRFHDVGYHGTGIASPFAAACVAAKLMGDTKETLVNALGICGSQSAAIQEFLHDGTWTKKIHPGWAAHSAIYALSLARNGYTGPAKVFEGGFGMWMTHCGGIDGLEEEFADLGIKWHTPEITVKLYPVCHMTHSTIDCMISLMEENGFSAEDIDHAECRIASRYYAIVCSPREVKVRPDTDYIMRFSLPYVVAMAAIKHRVSPWEIDLKYAKDPKVCGLMDRIFCVEDDSKDNPGYFPGYLTVVLKDGRTFVKDQRYEMGTRQNPLNLEAVNRKLLDNLSTYYSEERIRQITGLLEQMEQLPDADTLIQVLKRDK
ncbi:MAG: MmgE/PrpD family protein [Enterocloster sp.]|nr:MmgE/PrpD family protein [Enterocloster sp.]